MLRLGVQTAAEFPPKQYAFRIANPRRTSESKCGVFTVVLPSAAIESMRMSYANKNSTFGRGFVSAADTGAFINNPTSVISTRKSRQYVAVTLRVTATYDRLAINVGMALIRLDRFSNRSGTATQFEKPSYEWTKSFALSPELGWLICWNELRMLTCVLRSLRRQQILQKKGTTN